MPPRRSSLRLIASAMSPWQQGSRVRDLFNSFVFMPRRSVLVHPEDPEGLQAQAAPEHAEASASHDGFVPAFLGGDFDALELCLEVLKVQFGEYSFETVAGNHQISLETWIRSLQRMKIYLHFKARFAMSVEMDEKGSHAAFEFISRLARAFRLLARLAAGPRLELEALAEVKSWGRRPARGHVCRWMKACVKEEEFLAVPERLRAALALAVRLNGGLEAEDRAAAIEANNFPDVKIEPKLFSRFGSSGASTAKLESEALIASSSRGVQWCMPPHMPPALWRLTRAALRAAQVSLFAEAHSELLHIRIIISIEPISAAQAALSKTQPTAAGLGSVARQAIRCLLKDQASDSQLVRHDAVRCVCEVFNLGAALAKAQLQLDAQAQPSKSKAPKLALLPNLLMDRSVKNWRTKGKLADARLRAAAQEPTKPATRPEPEVQMPVLSAIDLRTVAIAQGFLGTVSESEVLEEVLHSTWNFLESTKLPGCGDVRPTLHNLARAIGVLPFAGQAAGHLVWAPSPQALAQALVHSEELLAKLREQDELVKTAAVFGAPFLVSHALQAFTGRWYAQVENVEEVSKIKANWARLEAAGVELHQALFPFMSALVLQGQEPQASAEVKKGMGGRRRGVVAAALESEGRKVEGPRRRAAMTNGSSRAVHELRRSVDSPAEQDWIALRLSSVGQSSDEEDSDGGDCLN